MSGISFLTALSLFLNIDSTRPTLAWACPAARQPKLEIVCVKPVVTRRLSGQKRTPNLGVVTPNP